MHACMHAHGTLPDATTLKPLASRHPPQPRTDMGGGVCLVPRRLGSRECESGWGQCVQGGFLPCGPAQPAGPLWELRGKEADLFFFFAVPDNEGDTENSVGGPDSSLPRFLLLRSTLFSYSLVVQWPALGGRRRRRRQKRTRDAAVNVVVGRGGARGLSGVWSGSRVLGILLRRVPE
jgi:hypothetical protein